MTGGNEKNPEESWADMIREFGDDHAPSGPKLSNYFAGDTYILMWHVSWFKFAGKMIGSKGRTLVFDPLEGLGGWTVACETGDVVAVLPVEDSYEQVRAAWTDEKIVFEKSNKFLTSTESGFGGLVSFDLCGQRSKAEWKLLFEQASRLLIDGGVLIAGGMPDVQGFFLKEAAALHFKHVFLFGKGQPHPCISPADAVIIMAC
ncbi:hypothetical protein [Maridesulfovibrio hydrothermalis]|uniref:Uncharacterized protein n=1 Tax=Maridesulfovibrio hydrothermalis AM13 = DSM 14728 TaxID=1121451 RepID=L0RD42_9BACT|nr:hypothetical protein [Maridesulfovibrio hydrothermalis]CCO23456.1 conserved protein of unknown function [Maridesulfovibrio hydrothermalis AM13 = DSM 14728]